MKPLTPDYIKSLYRPLKTDAHKGTQGHALIIAGSYGKMGAAVLCSRAALTSGCGLVTAFIPRCGYQILQSAFPEAMVITGPHEESITDIKIDFSPSAIGIGPGIGQDEKTQSAFAKFLSAVHSPLVIDADALNILSSSRELFEKLPPQTILTPHPKEFERLVGQWGMETERIEKAKHLSAKYDLILVLKGAPTQIVYRESILVNTTGNPALATAGSGDVLTGIITGLLAQGYDAIDAASVAVFLHGLSADIGSAEISQAAFTASHIIRYLGKAFLQLEKNA